MRVWYMVGGLLVAPRQPGSFFELSQGFCFARSSTPDCCAVVEAGEEERVGESNGPLLAVRVEDLEPP